MQIEIESKEIRDTKRAEVLQIGKESIEILGELVKEYKEKVVTQAGVYVPSNILNDLFRQLSERTVNAYEAQVVKHKGIL